MENKQRPMHLPTYGLYSTSMEKRTYIAIDLKSFYASVECRERNLNPLDVNLVVADSERSSKTICLAVTPALKEHGIKSRSRLFEIEEKVRKINEQRKANYRHEFRGSSYSKAELQRDRSLSLAYITARPRMALYIEYSSRIYEIYLRFVSAEDIHVYSIDEVFIDASDYLNALGISSEEFARRIIREIFSETGITATAGIGENLYLAKIAMDIMAKKTEADEYGVRISTLDEMSYRKKLWDHTPITDFWRVGKGYARRLEEHRIFTMGDIARTSIENEALLFRLFGINAELLIDHAWGYEPCTMKDIKEYHPEEKSISSGQVLQTPYDYEKAMLVVKEMADALAFSLSEKNLLTDQIALSVGYDIENLKDPEAVYENKIDLVEDYYGRIIPKGAHGSIYLGRMTSSSRLIMKKAEELFRRIISEDLLVRRFCITALDVRKRGLDGTQLELFPEDDGNDEEKEESLKKAAIEIKRKYGKNAILRLMDFEEGATAKERNKQIGGHKA